MSPFPIELQRVSNKVLVEGKTRMKYIGLVLNTERTSYISIVNVEHESQDMRGVKFLLVIGITFALAVIIFGVKMGLSS